MGHLNQYTYGNNIKRLFKLWRYIFQYVNIDLLDRGKLTFFPMKAAILNSEIWFGKLTREIEDKYSTYALYESPHVKEVRHLFPENALLPSVI